MDELSQIDYSSRNISNIKNKKRRQELYQKLKHEQQKAKSKLRKAKKKLIEEKGRTTITSNHYHHQADTPSALFYLFIKSDSDLPTKIFPKVWTESWACMYVAFLCKGRLYMQANELNLRFILASPNVTVALPQSLCKSENNAWLKSQSALDDW